MSKNKQKLELTWIGKDDEYKDIEPRILVEVPEKSYGDKNTENMLIHGDNLLALKALEQDYTGKIKCIYIDPPYNTGSAFEHYDDNVEHSKWLSLMKSRLEILKTLLANDGVIFVQIDDNEQAYLKILMDEIFGRQNFVNCISVKMSEASGNKMAHVDKRMIKIKEYILIYKKANIKLNPIKIQKESWDDEYNKIFLNFTQEDKKFIDTIANKSLEITEEDVTMIDMILSKVSVVGITEAQKIDNVDIDNVNEVSKWLFDNSYRIFRTAASSSVKNLTDEKKEYCKNTYFSVLSKRDKLLYVVKSDYAITSNSPRVQVLFAQDYLTTYLGDLWTDISTTGLEAEGGTEFKNSKKPEKLIERVLTLGSNKGDLVLDSFLGSGTTAAVAHKMGRKWIGIELGDHCYTHCEPRLQKVVDGTDQGGISKAVNWQGGGGYKFYELAPSLLKKDEFDNWIIEPKYDAEMLAEAMAKHEGYKFSPDENNVYKQGFSTEKDFIFTTTQFLSVELLNNIHNKLEKDESLLICATHFEEGVGSQFDNITVKKIPQILLNRCEFGRMEYNLNIIEEAKPEDFEEDEILEDEE